MRLMHNLASLNIFRQQNINLANESKALGRISSGQKINSAKDDPNALSKSESMRMQIRGLQMAQRNAQNGVSMLQTAEGGMDNITSVLQKIRELTVQAGDATTTEDDRKEIQSEISQAIQGIDDMAKNNEFNGNKLLCSTTPNDQLNVPIGANVGESISIPKYNLTSSNLMDSNGNKLSDIDVTNSNNIDGALNVIDASIAQVTAARSKYGALENRLQSTYDNLGGTSNSIIGADSGIRDADLAEEMMEYAKNNVLVDAGNAMMAQSNKFPQDVLSILQNVRSR